MYDKPAIGILGGSGLYDIPDIEDLRTHDVETPFGNPSDAPIEGIWNGRRVIFIARHGQGHRIDPSHVPYRANIYAMKQLGVRRILAVSAVGSLKEGLPPGHMVAVEQFIDRTRHRDDSFFGDGCVAHVSLADPICKQQQQLLVQSARAENLIIQDGGTYVCMEGPQFSTRAESNMYRSFGASVIGMTNLTEARLAREAEICYATLALVTDYDCWHEAEEDVSAEAVVQTVRSNVRNAQRVLARTLSALDPSSDCPCQRALDGAVMTHPGHLSDQSKAKLGLLLERISKN